MAPERELRSDRRADPIGLMIAVVSAYVANNPVGPGDLAGLMRAVHATFVRLGRNVVTPPAPEVAFEKPTPAQIRRSIRPDALISFIDGRPRKMLKRHVAYHGLTFDAYKLRYGLPDDYPHSCEELSAYRSSVARGHGLGGRNYRHDPDSIRSRQRAKARAEAQAKSDAMGAPSRPGRANSPTATA